MKKILLTMLVAFTCISTSYAAEDPVATNAGQNVIKVTEKIPGADCKRVGEEKLYTCTTKRGFGSVLSVMASLLRYFTFLCGLFSVLALVVGGIMYSMGGASEEMKTTAKTYITRSLLGLILLLLSGSILYAVAPWVYTV